MEIIIENCSSAGASFTEHTNKTLLLCNELIVGNENKVAPFITFRRQLETEKNVNDNNARNIYPLLRYCGFINYEKSSDLCYSNFFTNLGEAYVKILESISILDNSDGPLSPDEKAAKENLVSFQQNLIVEGIKNLLKNDDCNYKKELIACANSIYNFNGIDKNEFAYLLFEFKKSDTNYIMNMRENIQKYRDGKLHFDVKINIRNDDKNSTNERKLEDISYLTSYNYFISLFVQAGFLEKSKNRYDIILSKKNVLKELFSMEK